MNRNIQTVSKITRILLLIVLFLIPITLVFFWFSSNHLFLTFNPQLLPTNLISHEKLGSNYHFWAFLLSWLPGIASMLILYYFAQLFGYYQRGKIFTVDNAKCLRNAGIVIFAWEVIRPFYDMLMAFVLLPSQLHASIDIHFNTSNIRGFIIAVVLIVVAWVMQEAANMKQEQELTI